MKISTRGRYALRFMIDLALQNSDQFIALKDISGRQEISVKYLEQITSLLGKYGLLRSVRGQQGGYKLAKPASQYTIGEILRITEGNLAPVACLDTAVNECPRCNQCKTLPFWEGLAATINSYLDSVTLADLAAQESAVAPVSAQAPLHAQRP